MKKVTYATDLFLYFYYLFSQQTPIGFMNFGTRNEIATATSDHLNN